jgi:hypothetical protein
MSRPGEVHVLENPEVAEFKLFYSLSIYLTGEPILDGELARRHFGRLEKVVGREAVKNLLVGWRAAMDDSEHTEQRVHEILSDPVRGPTAKTLLVLWYTGGIRVLNANIWNIESAADYFGALAWKVVGSHPPGFSNQFYGHWKYPTEY